MNKNFLVYQRLKLTDERRFKPGEYVVIIGGKVFRRGKTLEKYLSQARKKYPGEVPLVTKVPQGEIWDLFINQRRFLRCGESPVVFPAA